MNPSQAFALYQPVLHSIAFKMVGSIADAEDIVHDTFLKWLSIDSDKIQNTKAYLIRAVTNNCLNHLQALKKRKNQYLEDIFEGSELYERYKATEFPKFDIETEISEALAVLHHKLEPLERGIYVLREVFNMEYEEMQDIFDKKKENCRQLFCRARKKLSNANINIDFDLDQQKESLENFKKGCKTGYPSDFINQVTRELKAKFQK